MGKAPAKRGSLGKRAGTKRKDYHWISPDGSTWDSRFEYIFYSAARAADLNIVRCEKSDTIPFTLNIRKGICAACGSAKVGQQRSYTPDFRVIANRAEPEAKHYYIECKGFLRPKERALWRSFYKAHPDAPIRVVFQRAYPVGARRSDGTKGSIVEWFNKFMPNIQVAVWTGSFPLEFKSGQGPKKGNKRASAKPAISSRKRRVSTKKLHG
jgi:ribosomal protein L37E